MAPFLAVKSKRVCPVLSGLCFPGILLCEVFSGAELKGNATTCGTGYRTRGHWSRASWRISSVNMSRCQCARTFAMCDVREHASCYDWPKTLRTNHRIDPNAA